MKNITKLITISALTALTLTPITAKALTKNESVFSSLNTNGSVFSTTVTNYLKVSSKQELEDNSELKEITNVNGDETFTKNNNTLKWKTDGKDIYYQGTTTKDLPLDINIKYYLNDKETKLEDLKNKKGKVKIEITLKNKEKHYVNINGTIEEVYTPFIVMAGTTINNKDNQNIEITNGKIVDTGSKSIATAIASPGLYESLNMNSLKNINKITLTYDTTKFNMSNIYIIATPKLLEKQDLDLFDNIDNIYASIQKLQSSMNEIDSGSHKLAKYTKQLSDGVEELNKNMPSEASNKENETKLNSLKTTNNQTVNTLTSANTNLESQKEEISTKITEATAKKAYIESQITSVENNIAAIDTAYNNCNSQLSTVNAGIESTQQQIAQATDPETIAQLKTSLAELQATKAVLQNTLQLLPNQKAALEGTKNALQGTKDAIEGTIELLNSTKSSIETSITANNNLSALISGNNKVVGSSLDTINKMRILTSSIGKIASGSKEISKNTTKLANGITEFNNQGINTITNYSNVIKKYSNKAEALVDLSKNYNGFTSNNSDETLFINKVKTID